MKKQLTFKKTMTVYVEQTLTYQEFIKNNSIGNDESKLMEVWKRMSEKADKHGQIDVEDGEIDDELDDYNCDYEIEEMVEEFMEEIKQEDWKEAQEYAKKTWCRCDCGKALFINPEDKDLKNLCQPCWDKKHENM
jgi:hypothetical protein